MKSRVLWRNLPKLEKRITTLENILKNEESQNG